MRILLMQTAFLGDVVLTLPLLHTVRHHIPQACIDVVTVPGNAALLREQPGVHDVIPYDKRGKQRGLRGLFDMACLLRARRYDLALAPHRSMRTALLLAWSGIPQRVSFAHWSTRWAYTTTVPRPQALHEAERNIHLLTALELAPTSVPVTPIFRIAPDARQEAQTYFSCHGVQPGEAVIGLIPGSQWGTKRWPAERFAALIARLSTMWQARFALFGGSEDRPLADRIIQACGVSILDLVDRTSVRELPAYLDRCNLVISNDTGPMHIAAALGKPILVLYGPTTASLGFFPYGTQWEEASVGLACRPCHAHGPQRCPLSHWRCMLDLSVEQVAMQAQRLWEQM